MFLTLTECSTYGANISCLKKRCLYTTKVSCYLQSSVYYLYYALKITKIYVKKYIK